MNINNKQYFNKIKSELNKLNLSNNPKELYEPIKYILKMKSKKIRPILSILSYKLKKNNWQEIVQYVIAIELFHNFTLIHDDIIDNATLRRGKQTIHNKWNDNIGILSGDLLMVIANKIFSDLPLRIMRKVLNRFNEIAIKVCEGQQYDMNYENEKLITEKQYINMIRLKTATLIGFSLELGGILSKMKDLDIKNLYQFGEFMGIGFQLQDDYLDVFGNRKFGKKIGGDILLNKKTYLLIKLLESTNEKEKIIIHNWINNSNNPTKKIEAITNLMKDKNIDSITETVINNYFNKAFDYLKKIDIKNSQKNELIEFSKKLINRKN
ncbi:MAG TPA: polyprenyl synthetase family protein [Cytophagales bacterium]|jgi:geranylgeranyl diphosphate synthase type II|nr:polyprenyl synthetase family protein [Cytophagales bacterium]